MDFTWIFKLFEAAKNYGGWGIAGAISVTLFALSAKYVLVPTLTKILEKYSNINDQMIKEIAKMNESIIINNEIMKNSVENFSKSIKVAENQRSSIEQKVDVLIGENSGNLDSKIALTTFSWYLHKQHLSAFAFFNVRLKNNHMDSQGNIIKGRYDRKADELGGKTFTNLGYYSHKGIPLSTFLPSQHICDAYFHNIMNNLFQAHERMYTDPNGLTLEDVESALDRQLSKMMGAFKLWLSDDTKTLESTFTVQMFDLWESPVNNIEYFDKNI